MQAGAAGELLHPVQRQVAQLVCQLQEFYDVMRCFDGSAHYARIFAFGSQPDPARCQQFESLDRRSLEER